MSDGFNPVAFGRMQAQVDGIEKDLTEIKSKLDHVMSALDKARGAKWAFGAFVAALASGTTHALHKWLS